MHTSPLNARPSIRVLAFLLAVLTSTGGMGSAPTRASSTESGSTASANDKDGKRDFRGVDLGKYQVRTYYPLEGQKSVVAFTLYATVTKDNAAEFERLLKNRRHKVRDQVIVATRLVPLTDFNDSDLTSFRRRILLRLRRMLPELPIQDVYISDFELSVKAF